MGLSQQDPIAIYFAMIPFPSLPIVWLCFWCCFLAADTGLDWGRRIIAVTVDCSPHK